MIVGMEEEVKLMRKEFGNRFIILWFESLSVSSDGVYE